MSEPEKIYEEIVGALARGYCYEPNKNKELDGDLIKSMGNEVLTLLQAERDSAEAVRKELEEEKLGRPLLAKATDQCREMETEITALKSRVEELKTQIKGLKNQLKSYEIQFAHFKIGKLVEEYTALEKELEAAKEESESGDKAIAQLLKERATLRQREGRYQIALDKMGFSGATVIGCKDCQRNMDYREEALAQSPAPSEEKP